MILPLSISEDIQLGTDTVVAHDLPSKRIQKRLGVHVSNKQLDQLWLASEGTVTNITNRLKRRGNKITQLQLIRLEENQKRYKILAGGETLANFGLKSGEKIVGDFLDKDVLSEDNLKSIDKAFNNLYEDLVPTEMEIK